MRNLILLVILTVTSAPLAHSSPIKDGSQCDVLLSHVTAVLKEIAVAIHAASEATGEDYSFVEQKFFKEMPEYDLTEIDSVWLHKISISSMPMYSFIVVTEDGKKQNMVSWLSMGELHIYDETMDIAKRLASEDPLSDTPIEYYDEESFRRFERAIDDALVKIKLTASKIADLRLVGALHEYPNDVAVIEVTKTAQFGGEKVQIHVPYTANLNERLFR